MSGSDAVSEIETLRAENAELVEKVARAILGPSYDREREIDRQYARMTAREILDLVAGETQAVPARGGEEIVVDALSPKGKAMLDLLIRSFAQEKSENARLSAELATAQRARDETAEPVSCPMPGACSCSPEGVDEAARKIRAKALREAAKIASSFLVGDPDKGVPLRNPMSHEIAAKLRARAAEIEEGRG